MTCATAFVKGTKDCRGASRTRRRWVRFRGGDGHHDYLDRLGKFNGFNGSEMLSSSGQQVTSDVFFTSQAVGDYNYLCKWGRTHPMSNPGSLEGNRLQVEPQDVCGMITRTGAGLFVVQSPEFLWTVGLWRAHTVENPNIFVGYLRFKREDRVYTIVVGWRLGVNWSSSFHVTPTNMRCVRRKSFLCQPRTYRRPIYNTSLRNVFQVFSLFL
jgi:hypothetical protein